MVKYKLRRTAKVADVMALFTRILQELTLSERLVFCGISGVRYRRWQSRNKNAPDKTLQWATPLIEYTKQKQEESAKGIEKEPHALHVIYRVKPLAGRPWWEKEIMTKLGLDGRRCADPVIHKNTPSINKKLAQVKHLVKIMELKFPHGIPEHPSDFENTQIKINGEMIVTKRLQGNVSDGEVEDSRAKWRLQMDTIEKANKDILDRYAVHTEYVETYYNYTRNQDGKEYRYNFNKPDKK